MSYEYSKDLRPPASRGIFDLTSDFLRLLFYQLSGGLFIYRKRINFLVAMKLPACPNWALRR